MLSLLSIAPMALIVAIMLLELAIATRPAKPEELVAEAPALDPLAPLLVPPPLASSIPAAER